MLSTSLYHASDQERESTVDLLLKYGADSNAKGDEYISECSFLGPKSLTFGYRYGTALIAAAYDGSEKIMESLLEHNANPNIQHEYWGTALEVAASFGNTVTTQLLLDHGASVEPENVGRYGNALQAACYAANKTLVENLVARGANINAKGGKFSYPIIAAADEGRAEIVEYLVNHGANVNVVYENDDDCPLIVVAGFTLSKEYMELLLNHGANLESTDDPGNTVLIAAAVSCDPEGVKMLLDRGANIHASGTQFGTALYGAASEGDEECCDILLQRGAQVNQQSGPWNTALQAAAKAADLETIEMLLEAGANVHLTGGEFGTALQAAAFSGSLECLRALLTVGANVNQEGGKYGAPLQAAAYAGRDDCLHALVEAGASVNYRGGKYGCASQAAAAKGHSGCMQILLEAGADVNIEGGKYGTTFQAAVYANSSDIVTTLLEHHANIHTEGGLYENALDAAVWRDHTDVLSLLIGQEVPDAMLDKALLQAVHHRQPAAVEILLKNGASVQAKDPVLGSVFDTLQNDVPDDTNSDDMGDWDNEAEGSNDPDNEDEDQEEGEDDADTNVESNDEALDADFANLQLEDCSPEEKIRKILEEAMAKVKRNPTIERFRTVKNKTIPQEEIGGQASAGANSTRGFPANNDTIYQPMSTPQNAANNQAQTPAASSYPNGLQTLRAGPVSASYANTPTPPAPAAATGIYQAHGDEWRASRSPPTSGYEVPAYRPSQTAGSYGRQPSIPHSYSDQPRQSATAASSQTHASTAHNYQIYGGSQAQQAYNPTQYQKPIAPAYINQAAYNTQSAAPQSYDVSQHPYQTASPLQTE